MTPTISPTEAAALEAGTIGFDRDLFDGTASLGALKNKYQMASLTPEEQSFMDKEVRMHRRMKLVPLLRFSRDAFSMV